MRAWRKGNGREVVWPEMRRRYGIPTYNRADTQEGCWGIRYAVEGFEAADRVDEAALDDIE
jgi:hypothetical protein